MAKELRIVVTVKLPDEMFAEADMLVSAKKPVKTLVESLIAECGQEAVAVECATVTPKPRGAKENGPTPLRGVRHHQAHQAEAA